MKQKFLLLSVFITITVFSFAQDLSNPGDYMTAITNAQNDMNQKYMAYMSATAHVRRARKIDKMRQAALESIQVSRENTASLPYYKDDNSLRQSSMDYIKFCYNVFNEDYEKILNLEDIAEQSYDEMQAYLLLQEKTSEKIQEANQKMHDAEVAFAAKYNVNLIEQKSELGEKLGMAGKLNHYRNQLYLMYFKCNWQYGEIIKAMNDGKITEAEQGRNSMIRFAGEGLAGLDSLKSFDGDPSMALMCKDVLLIYKNIGENDMPKQIDYFLKKESFEKMQKSFEAKSQSDRTKQDVNAYNAAVKDINKASDLYNSTNKKISEEISDADDQWNKTEKSFADEHMPYYK